MDFRLRAVGLAQVLCGVLPGCKSEQTPWGSTTDAGLRHIGFRCVRDVE